MFLPADSDVESAADNALVLLRAEETAAEDVDDGYGYGDDADCDDADCDVADALKAPDETNPLT